jgi:hypothetical protein
MIEDICDVCCGQKPLNDRPCICGGTGKMTSALHNLRAKYLALQSWLEHPFFKAALEMIASGDQNKADDISSGKLFFRG